MNNDTSPIEKETFMSICEGKDITLFTLRNNNGASVKIINYGGIITSIKVPNKEGNLEDVVLGFDSIEDYLKVHPYFGALIGRYANRIGQGHFILNGEKIKLATNNGVNSLHGGNKGFDKVLWECKEEIISGSPALSLRYLSKDGEENYPGNLQIQVWYILTQNNTLEVHYLAETDKTTVINLTNHSYFNLSPSKSSDILGHIVTINADSFTPVDETLIPTGELRPVSGTPMDFRTPHTIGERINVDDEQLYFGKGYDHNWVINGKSGSLRLASKAFSPSSGIGLEVYTTEPGIQMYTGNFLDGSLIGKGKKVYNFRSGFCFETQHFPDSPNKPYFPTTLLNPGETFKSTTIFAFSIR